MSNRIKSGSSRLTGDEIDDLILKLQALLSQLVNPSRSSRNVSTSKVLKEACSYIKKLLKEVDDLSDRLSQFLDAMDANGFDSGAIRSLFLQ